MKIRISTKLNADSTLVWQEVVKSSTLRNIAYPLVTFKGDLPDEWKSNIEYKVKMFLLGFVPLGNHRLTLKIDDFRREILSNETGSLIKVWNHLIQIRSTGNNLSQYTDEVEIKAGWKTIFIWLFAHIFYRYRQYRWKGIIKSLDK